MIERWRCFMAVTPGQAIHKQVQELLRDLGPACKEAGHKIRWVHPAKIHLTLRFLGDITVPLAMALEDACRPLSELERFRIAYRRLGAFPDPARPRVVWLGLDDPEGRLSNLNSRLTAILEEQGIPPDRRGFTPHVTIGRVRTHGGESLDPLFDRFSEREIGEEVVSRIIFYRSTLDPAGAVHEPKWFVNLGRERSGRE